MSNLHEGYIDTVLLIALVPVLLSYNMLFCLCPFLPTLVNTEFTQTGLEAS